VSEWYRKGKKGNEEKAVKKGKGEEIGK